MELVKENYDVKDQEIEGKLLMRFKKDIEQMMQQFSKEQMTDSIFEKNQYSPEECIYYHLSKFSRFCRKVSRKANRVIPSSIQCIYYLMSWPENLRTKIINRIFRDLRNKSNRLLNIT